MKNFTNNFKQFTSRLSARWLIIALMMLVGTSSAWAVDWYLTGTFNNWSTNNSNYKLKVNSGNKSEYYITGVKLLAGDEFKFVDSNNNWKGWNDISTKEGGDLENKDGNIKVKNSGTYDFYFTPSTKLYTTYVACASCCTDNYVAGNTDLTGYDWNPGQNKMTCSNNLYSKTFTNVKAGTHQFKITNGSWGWSTDNITTKSGSNYLSLSKDGGNIKFTTTSIYNITIYFDGSGCYATYESACTPPAAPTLNPNSTTVCSGTPFDLPSGYRWYTVQTGGTKLSSNTISSGVTKQTVYHAEAGEDGCVSTSRTAYTVNVDPKSALELTEANPTICQGSSIVLSNYVESSKGTVKWYSNSGMTEEITNPSVARTPQSNPTYYYARAKSGVCSSIDKTLTVTVASAPTTPTLNTTDEFLSIGESATLTIGNKESDVTYTLYKDGVSTSKVPSGTQFTNITDAGVYTVKGSKSANPSGCQETGFSNDVTIRTCTSATYSIAFTNDVTSINTDATILASVTPSGTGYGTVTWESETTSVATIDASGVITGVKFGTSKITATVADGDTYCGGTATETITVKETPTITISGETKFCGESTTLTAAIENITDGNSYNIKWYEDGNNTAKGTGSTFSPTKSGTYIVKVTGNFVNETSKTVVVTKKAYPTAANFTVTNNNYTYDGAAKAATVKWTDNQSAEGITVTYNPATPKDADIYDIQVTTTAHGDLCASNGAITLGDKLTINKADQTTALTITASTNICGKEATFSVTGGDGTGDYSYSLDKNDAGVSLNGTTLTATQNGSVTLKVKKLGDANYNDSEEAVKMFNFTMPIENVNLSIIKGLSASGDYCVGTEIQLKLTYTGATPANDGSHFEWVKDGFSSEIGNNEGGIATGATWTTTLGVNDKTLKVKLKDCNGGWVESNELTFNVFERPDAPKFNPNYMTVCQGQAFTLPGSEAEGYIWSDATGKPTTPNKPNGIDATAEYYAVISFGCPSDATEFTVNVNPLPVPVISADLEAVNVGETITLTVEGDNIENIEWYATDGTKEYNVTEITANQATITSNENAIITVTVTATSANGCVATATKDVTFGSENCEVSNADYIEILCRRTNNPESATADRDMHCYAWITGTTGTLLGGWPGVKTENGDFEYKGKKYAVWHIKSDAEVSIIFSNNGSDDAKTGDLTGHIKGYRYIYTLSSDYKTATLYEEPSLINMPEVRTISVTSERQANGDLKVYMSGKILKKGCAAIKSYGFQYKKDNGDYTGTAGIVEDKDKDAGFVFTAETTLTKGNYGEYTFRARLINENSTKVYGEEFKIYFYESDVFIEAVGNDKQVTNKTGVYYDFVGLYVKNVIVPVGTSINRYKWLKNGNEYNDGNATVADRGVSSSSNNIRPNEAGTYTCEVTLSNGDILESNEIVVSATNTYSEVVTSKNRNLPVISVRTNEAFPTCQTAGTTGAYPSTNIEGWKEKRSVDVKIFNADGTLYYDRKARMNYRGSSSLNFNKKSYAFCPGEENCGQEKDKTPDYVTTTKMNLFDLSNGAKDKDWVLYAAAADPTLMRNRLVFDTYKAMRGSGAWGVDSKYVELVIDGVYQGVYVLMDKITNNEKRVNITDPNGFIVKFDKTDIADREADLLNADQEVGDEKTFLTKRTGRVGIQTYHTFVDQLFEIEYPEKKKVVKNGGDWSTTLSAIKQKFEEFETALADGDYIKVRSLIDYESWADWFIINEFTKNVDAYRASCVFVYNGNKIEAQPLWDQELSFNNAAGANIGKKGADKTTGLLIENNGVYTDCFPAPFWWTGTQSSFNNCGTNDGESTISSEKIQNYLLKDECFVATIKDRWDTHTEKGGALHKDQLMAKYSALLTELGAAKDREITKWPSNHRVADACGGPGTGYNDVTFKDSQDALEAWIDQDLVEISSESESASRASNLNYLIENMEGEPLRFDLTLNPASGVTTPWIPVTITVEVPDGYEYTYDDSAIKAHEGVIIKSSTDKHSYTFPRPENWETGNQGEGNEIEPLFYEVNVSLNIETTETASCGESKFETSKTAIISLQDEGDDLCNYAD